MVTLLIVEGGVNCVSKMLTTIEENLNNEKKIIDNNNVPRKALAIGITVTAFRHLASGTGTKNPCGRVF